MTLEQPHILQPQPQAGDLIGHVGVQRRRNKDRSMTVYLRWREHGTGPEHKDFTQRFARTGPRATKHEVRQIVAEARIRAKEMEDWMRDGRPVRKDGRRYFLRPAVANYLDWLHPATSESTYGRREMRLFHLLKWFSEVHPKVACVHQMIPAKVQEYVDAAQVSRRKPLKYGTLRLIRCDLRHFFTFCMKHLWTSINPADMVTLPRPEHPESPFILPLKTVHEILAGDNQPIRVVRFLFGTGLRALSELETIRWRHCNTADGLLMVPKHKYETTKRHGRVIPIGRDLVRLLREWRDGHGPDELVFAGGHKLAARLLRGYVLMERHATPSGCRDWYGTMLEKQGCPDTMVQLLLGHVPSGNLRYYIDRVAALDLDRARGFVDAVDEMLRVEKAAVDG